MKNYLQKMIGFLKPEHIWNYANSISFSLSDEEVMILYSFIKDHYLELLESEEILLKLKPKIREDLYLIVLEEYKKNKAKYC